MNFTREKLNVCNRLFAQRFFFFLKKIYNKLDRDQRIKLVVKDRANVRKIFPLLCFALCF